MSRLLVPLAGVAWVGATLVLSTTGWAGRRSLADRIAPYVPVGTGRTPPPSPSRSLRQAVGPVASELGDAVARLAGVAEPAARRLARIGATESVTDLRTRQASWAVGTFLALAAVVTVAGLPPTLALVVLVGLPTAAFLVPEQQLATASARYQERLVLELPIVAEQLGMLLSAGYSMGGALGRIAGRGTGVVAADVRRVGDRTRQGLDEHAALEEWAELADVAALHRLVAVLGLQRQAADLGRLISEEARSMRQDAHRQLLESIERRSQQVWVPVTVATLVPGVAFLAVPFIEALRLFTAG